MLDLKKEIEQWGPIDSTVLYPSFWFASISGAFKHRWGVSWSELYAVYDHDRTTFYWTKRDLERQGFTAIEQWLLRKSNLDKLWHLYTIYLKEIKIIARKKLGGLPLNKFRELARSWYEALIKFWDLTLVFEMANYAAPIYLKEKMQSQIIGKKLEHALEILLTPEKPSFHMQSELELLKIYITASKKGLGRRLER